MSFLRALRNDSAATEPVCTDALAAQCVPCVSVAVAASASSISTGVADPAGGLRGYDCTLPGLEGFAPGGQYEGIKANYLSFVTDTSSPSMPVRAAEFEACTGGKIAFAEAQNVWEDPLADLGSGEVKGFELYDGYFMSYSHFPEASSRGLAETLNERIRNSNEELRWEDVLPKVRNMGEYRKGGRTDIDFLMYDGDFFVPVIRLDLLEKYGKALPNTWEEVVELAVFFHGKDLNDDGNDDDYGFCHFPRQDAGYWDWWWPEAVYSTWATFDQTRGIGEGFFFDSETMDPRTSGAGFQEAAEIWKTLWDHGADGCITDNFARGRCAVGFAPPGCWKGLFLDPDGVHRRDENGTVVWRPRLKNGDVVEPYRFRPFGSAHYYDRVTGERRECTEASCPRAEPVPARGHDDLIATTGYAARAGVLDVALAPSPLNGRLVNRAPFYWSGGLGTMIRKSSEEVKKDLLWDFFVYTNSPATSRHDVANYASWLDSWRFSQLFPGDNFLAGGWSEDSYEEHAAVMKWALSAESNGALNLRIPALAKYTRDTVGELMGKYISNNITLDQLSSQVTSGWEKITDDEGKLNQLDIYRAALGLDPLSTVEKCRLHRDQMDQIDPSVCKQYDDDDTTLIITVLSSIVGAGILLLVMYFSYKRYRAYQAIKNAHEQLMESTLNKATRALRQLDYPLHLVRGEEFVREGKLMRHEALRNANRLVVLDNLSDVDAFIRAGKQVVFFSHQWTAFKSPDPKNGQFETMVGALDELARRNGWDESLKDVFVWVDYSCIPQANASVQNLAIRSLAVYASSATYFVIIAPETRHADLNDMCDLVTYQRRMWCRAEQVCHSMRNGTAGMFLATTKKDLPGVDFAPVKSDFFHESLRVFDGDLSCCSFEHRGMDSCDRQSLVVPILGLYGELLRAAHDGIEDGSADMSTVEAFLREIERHQEDVFPRTFSRVMWRKNKRIVEEVLLFGDLIDRMRTRIQTGKMYALQDRGGTESTASEDFLQHSPSSFVRHGNAIPEPPGNFLRHGGPLVLDGPKSGAAVQMESVEGDH